MVKIRKDTTDRTQGSPSISFKKQYLIGILGLRGSGKSYLAEVYLEKFYRAGFTCLDLWAAPNLENGFWIFPKKGSRNWIPITILAPEIFIVPEARVDRFNGKFITKEELVKFVKLPSPTKKTDSEQNKKILEILTKTIIECRDHRRILVFNPYMFPNETEMFRTLEILVRGLNTISNKHFDALEPEDVGKKSEEEMTTQERTHHKMCFLIREFGELAPARLKGDKSGESTLVKKALLKFVRLARHSNVNGIIDYQNASDVDSSIRNQIDIWLIKRWTRELGGDSFAYWFKTVKEKRDRFFEKNGWSKRTFEIADSYLPQIEKLSQNYYYFVKSGNPPILRKVRGLGIRHKEPDDKWWKLTGIPIEFDKQMLSQITTAPKKTSTNDEKLVYLTLEELRSRKGSKKLNWEQTCEIMAEKQENGELTSHLDFKTISASTLSKTYSRMRLKYESNLNKVGHASQA